jgi:SAM-dependent methyltransferase
MRLRALDFRDRLARRSDRLVPPRRLDFVGHSDFVELGNEFMAHFVELAGLRPHERVLDIGCGVGRMARPLSRYLVRPGSYAGFDVDRAAIGWCRRRYRALPYFHFHVADVHSRRFNPSGALSAADYRFPYADGSFDFVIGVSVFTHLLEGEARHYIDEIGRVLGSGGRLLATFFLLTDASRALIAEGVAGLPFLEAHERVAVLSDAVPEEAVAYGDDWVAEALAGAGLELVSTHPGSWSGREDCTSFQDIVVARRA